MTLSALALYAAVYFAAVATPGPGVAALAARVIGYGLRGVAPFILGFVVGDLVWLSIAATGLSIVAHGFSVAFFVLKILGAIYLLYVAWGLVRAKGSFESSIALREPPSGVRAFLGALSLTLSNPKVIVFFLSIMPLAVDLPKLTPTRFAILAAVSVVVLSATLSAYALAANRARAWMGSSRTLNLARKTAAGIMAGAAIAIVSR
jgi:threonine/homoserine/homoserine lactone efflux protein